jgi:hypothetical protein
MKGASESTLERKKADERSRYERTYYPLNSNMFFILSAYGSFMSHDTDMAQKLRRLRCGHAARSPQIICRTNVCVKHTTRM